MIAVFNFLLLLFSFSVFSADKVVVLTSLQDMKNVSRDRNQRLEDWTERTVKSHFRQSHFQIEIKHLATPKHLWDALQDHEVVGLIWLSHGRESGEISNGLSAPAVITDAFGNDVKNLFKRVSPRLKFLSLVTCQGQSLLEHLRSEGHHPTSLVTHGFTGKIAANSGIHQALRASQAILKETINHDSRPDDEDALLEVRQVSSGTKSMQVMIEASGLPLAVSDFTDGWMRAQVPKKIWDSLKRKNIKITALATSKIQGPLVAPRVQIYFESEGYAWQPFTIENEMLGGSTQLYLYRQQSR